MSGRQGIACGIGECGDSGGAQDAGCRTLAAVGLVADGVLHPIGKIQPLLIGWNVPDPVEPLRAYCVVSAAATPCARS